MSNPYLEGDEDADILGDDKNNINTGYGRKQFILRGPNGEELPPELQSTVAKYVSVHEDATIVGESLPIEFKAVSATFHYVSAWPTYQEEGPLIWAMAEILDEMTDGHLTRLYNLRETERVILYTHAVKRFMNSLYQALESFGSESNFIGETLTYVEGFVEICDFVHFKSVDEYRSLCKQLGREVDEEFIESGIYTTRSRFCTVAMARPYAKEEE